MNKTSPFAASIDALLALADKAASEKRWADAKDHQSAIIQLRAFQPGVEVAADPDSFAAIIR